MDFTPLIFPTISFLLRSNSSCSVLISLLFRLISLPPSPLHSTECFISPVILSTSESACSSGLALPLFVSIATVSGLTFLLLSTSFLTNLSLSRLFVSMSSHRLAESGVESGLGRERRDWGVMCRTLQACSSSGER